MEGQMELPEFEARWIVTNVRITRLGDGYHDLHLDVRHEHGTTWRTEDYRAVSADEVVDILAAQVLDRW